MAITLLDSYVIPRQSPANYIEGELDFYREEFLYQTNNVFLTDLQNCVVKNNGFVYATKKFRLNEFSLIDKGLYPNELSIKSYLKHIFFKKKRSLKNERYLLVHDD